MSKSVARTPKKQQQKKKKDPTTRRPRRSGTVVKRDIARYQRSRKPLLKRKPLERMIREISEKYSFGIRFQESALRQLLAEHELFLYRTFRNAKKCAEHAHRVQVNSGDLMLQLWLGESKA